MPALLVLLLAGCFDTTPGRDRDGDGFQNVELGGADCDDDNPLVFPGAGEQCANDDDGVGVLAECTLGPNADQGLALLCRGMVRSQISSCSSACGRPSVT